MRYPIVSLMNEETGEAALYKRYGARIPEFLEEFKLTDGWRIEGSMSDLLSRQKGLLFLYKACILAGRKPSDFGLPPIDDAANTFIFTTRFTDPAGRTLRTAGALGRVGLTKSYEMLESASVQRLMAACGHGGEIFDGDEDEDFKEQGLQVVPIVPKDANGRAMTANATEGADEPSTAADARENPDTAEPVAAATRDQVEQRAQALGVPVPTMNTQSEALAALRELGAPKQRRRRDAEATH